MYQFCSKLSFITHRNQWFLTVAKILLKKLTEIIYGACMVPSYVLLTIPSWYIFWGRPFEKKKNILLQIKWISHFHLFNEYMILLSYMSQLVIQ